MLAIAVTIRIDVYGMIYCAILGLLLLVPRRILAPLWLFLVFLQGLLLLLQYAMLLGVPPGVCFSKNGDKGTRVILAYVLCTLTNSTMWCKAVTMPVHRSSLNHVQIYIYVPTHAPFLLMNI